MSCLTSTLQTPPRYTSVIGEHFRIEPGLYAFPGDFGQGAADQRIFQIDASYNEYLDEKHAARHRRPGDIYLERDLDPAVQAAVCQLIVNQLSIEHPNYFRLQTRAGTQVLDNALRQDRLAFRRTAGTVQWQPEADDGAPYNSPLDALAMQVQEDLVILSRQGDRHWVSAIHLCFPNHWAASDKIGRPFGDLHAPVPHFERIGAMESRLVSAIIERGPYVRFAWGLSFDNRLDHFPGGGSNTGFDPENPQLYLRMERQCIVGIPAVNCALFTIRTYYYDVGRGMYEADLPRRLRSAIASMSNETLRYKGIANDRDAILGWLEDLASP